MRQLKILMVVGVMGCSLPSSRAATYTVTSNSDALTGGTLREAVAASNANISDTINFTIPGQTLSPASPYSSLLVKNFGSSFTLNAPANLILSRPGQLIFSFVGAGLFTLNNNVYVNGLLISGSSTTLAGSLRVDTLMVSGGSTVSATLSLLGSGSTVDVAPGTAVFSGSLTGNALLTKTDTGTLDLTNLLANTATGGTRIDGGIIRVSDDSQLGTSGGLTFNGGTLQTTTGIVSSRNVTLLAGGGTLQMDGIQVTELNGIMSGAGPLTKTGTGTLDLTNLLANITTGGTRLNGGIIQVTDDSQLGTSGGLTFNGGTLQTVAGIFSARTITLNGSGTIDTNGQDSEFGGQITGSGPFTIVGGGSVSLTNPSLSNNYTGGTVVDGATLAIDDNAQLGASSGGLTLQNNGTLRTTNGILSARTITLNGTVIVGGSAGTIDTNGQDSEFSGRVTGVGPFKIVGGGSVALTNALLNNNYTGGTIVDGATLAIDDNAQLGAASGGLTLQNNGILRTTNGILSTRTITLNGTVIVGGSAGTIDTNGQDSEFSGRVTGTGPFKIVGGGSVSLTNSLLNNNYTGGTIVDGATLAIDDDAQLGALSGDLTLQNNGTLRTTTGIVSSRAVTLGTGGGIFDVTTGLTTLNGVISGAGNLTKTGIGTLTLSGANTYSGGTTVSGGSLQGNTTSLQGSILNNAVVIFNQGAAGTYAGTMGGTGSLAKTGAGTLTLSGANTYSGGTTVSGGTLQGTTTSLRGSILNNASVNFQGAGTYSGSMSGTGTLTKTGAGTLTLSGANTYSGGTTVSVGTLQGNATSLQGSILNNAAVTFNQSAVGTYAGIMSGTGNLTKTGGGTLILSGANTYSGGTAVSAGTLRVNGSLDSATVSVESGATLGGTGTLNGIVTVQNGGILAPGQSPGTLTVGGLVLNSGSILNYELDTPGVVGGGVNDLIIVNGNLTVDGIMNVTGLGGFGEGTYRLFNYTGTLSDQGLLFGSAPVPYEYDLDYSTSGQVNLNVTAALVQYWDGANTSPDGAVNGGTGTWNNGATNWTNAAGNTNTNWTGNLTAVFKGTAGTVTIADGETILAPALSFQTDGYTITTGTGGLTLTGIATIETNAGVTATINAPIAGADGLKKTGLGTLILGGTNTYTGGTNLTAGKLSISSNANLGDLAGGLTFDGGTLQTTATLASARSVLINLAGGTMEIGAATTTTWNGIISGDGALTKTGAGTLIVTGVNTYAGGTTISAGTLQIGNGTTGSVAGNIVNNGTLNFNRTNTITYGGAISGSGAVNANGVGQILRLTGNNTFAGDLTINGGGVVFIGSGGTSGSVTSNIVINVGSLLFDRSDDVVYNGVISGNGFVTKGLLGSGKLTFTQAQTYAGTLLINRGTVALTGAGSLANSGVSLSGAGTFDISGGGNQTIQDFGGSAGGQVLLGANALTFGTGNDGQFDGVISGTGGITKQGAGTQTLTGTNIYSGATTVLQGTLSIGSDANLGSGNLILNNGALWVTGATTIDNNVVLSGGVGAVSNDLAVTLSGAISGGGNFFKLGSDTLTLTGTNTYTGTTTVLQGTLSIGSDANLGTGDLILNNGALQVTGATTIDNNVNLVGVGVISNDAAVTLSGVISGGGNFFKLGSDTLTLTGTNTYTGTTTVLQGTLSLGSDANLGTGDLILNNGALQVTGATTIDNNVSLVGVGVISNDAAVTLSGVISGGGNFFKLGSDTLTLTGTNTYTGTTTVLQGTLSLASDANLGGGDLILNNGALLVTGATTIDNNVSLAGGVGLVSNSTAVTLSGIVSGAGRLVKEGTGALTLTGTNTYAGGTTVSVGTLRQGVTGAFVSNSAFTVNGGVLDLNNFNLTVSEVKGVGGTVALGTAALIVDQASDTSYAGAITGTGSVTKQGAGILALTGNNSFNGGLNLNAGVIEVGSATALGAGNVTVNGGILRALSTTLTGQSINVAGNYLQTGGTLYLRLFGTGNFDQLNVNGTATLGGGLQMNLQNGFLPQIGEQFMLVNATGGVTNQFASVTSNLAGSLGFTTIYNPNDVTLGAVSTTTIVVETIQLPFNDFSSTPNQHSVAANLDTFSTTGKMQDLIDYLNSLPGAALADAFDQLSPEELGALSRISRSYNVTFNSNLLSRLQELRAGVRGFSARGYAMTDTKGERYDLSQNVLFAGVNSTPESVGLTVKKKDPMVASLDNPWGVFATGTGQFGDVDARDGLKGYGFTTGGLTVGADYRWNEGFTTGAFVGYAGSEADLDGAGGKVEADAAKFGFYAAWQKHGFYVNSAVGGGYNDYETSRTVLGAKAEGETNGVEFNALAGVGYDFTPGSWRFGPSAHVEYSYMLIDGMTEHGSLAPLRISQQSVDSLATRLGWNLSYGWELPNGLVIAPQGSLSWRHEYFDGAESLQSRFASGAGGIFNTQVSGMNRDSALAGLSLLVQWSPTITTVLGYEAEVASQYDSSTINGRIVIGF